MSNLSNVGFVAPDPSQLSKLFPGFDIECLIATGGMGAVYRAVQTSLDRTVAIKILPREFTADAAFRAGFEAEAKAMARLNHPNLIGVYDFGERDGMLFIIMEYVAGQSIFESAHGIAIAPPDVVRLVSAICSGLAHAHQNGILHRDIKPANILLDLDAHPKIGDFGLARPVERKVQEGEEIFGTPHYTAPEVVNNPHAVDHHADIFSVGVVLHELLTGRLPADDPRPPSAIVKCHTRFDAIVRKATHPVPASRYHSAADMAKDLQAALTGPLQRVGPVAGPAPRPPRPVAPVRRKSSGSGGIIFAVLAAAGIGAYFFLKDNPVRVPVTKGDAETTAAPVATTPTAAPAATAKSPPNFTPPPKPTKPAPTSSGVETAFGSTTAPVIDDDGSSPESYAPPSVPPKSDVPAFLAMARSKMKERAKPLLVSHQNSLQSNCDNFERGLNSLIRKLGVSYRAPTLAVLETHYSQWKADSYRIPETLDDDIRLVVNADTLQSECSEKQATADKALEDGLVKLSATYILGLEKQIERLETDNDVGAIELVQKEIDRTKDDPSAFVELMRAK